MLYPVSREEVLEELRRVVGDAGAGSIYAILTAEVGDPSRTIVDQAIAVRADLVVMGTHGRSGSERLMIGSVAEKVVRAAALRVHELSAGRLTSNRGLYAQELPHVVHREQPHQIPVVDDRDRVALVAVQALERDVEHV